MPARTRAAQLFAHSEGFGIPGAIPTIRHNPGDLRHAPHTSHVGIGPNDIGIEPNDDAGWADLERQLQLFADRGMTIREAVYVYAPPGDNNPTEAYLNTICTRLGLGPETPMSIALTIPPEASNAT